MFCNRYFLSRLQIGVDICQVMEQIVFIGNFFQEQERFLIFVKCQYLRYFCKYSWVVKNYFLQEVIWVVYVFILVNVLLICYF